MIIIIDISDNSSEIVNNQVLIVRMVSKEVISRWWCNGIFLIQVIIVVLNYVLRL